MVVDDSSNIAEEAAIQGKLGRAEEQCAAALKCVVVYTVFPKQGDQALCRFYA